MTKYINHAENVRFIGILAYQKIVKKRILVNLSIFFICINDDFHYVYFDYL